MAYGHGLAHTSGVQGYWDTQSKFADTVEVVQPDNTLGCNRMVFVFTRTVPTGAREDQAIFGISIGKIVGGGQYGTLLAADMLAAETATTALRTSLLPLCSDAWTLSEVRWFVQRADHAASPKGNEVIGPPVRVTAFGNVWGSVSGRNADQVSSTVSWRTTSRRHWGRIYVPGIATTQIDPAFGRLKNTAVDTMATAFRTYEAALNTASMQLGVWTWRHKAFLQLSEIRVDNVLDIQRRRRAKQSNYNRSFTS